MRIRIKNTDDYEDFPYEYTKVLKKYKYKRETNKNKVFHYIEISDFNEYIQLYNELMKTTEGHIFGLLICDYNDENEICIEIYDEYRE